jgi:NAD(P)-dependent dehydrogenase (short-subunit alcohol dehydrogenase family)
MLPVALITAGTAGLGAATARLFASAGYRVAINYANNSERAIALLHELERASPLDTEEDRKENFVAIQADVSKRDEIVELVNKAASAMGRIDVVFSNHGWTEIRGFESLDANMVEEDWDRCYAMNVKSHLWLMHAAKPYLDASEGAFISTASLAGVRPSGSSLVSLIWTRYVVNWLAC